MYAGHAVLFLYLATPTTAKFSTELSWMGAKKAFWINERHVKEAQWLPQKFKQATSSYKHVRPTGQCHEH